MHAITQKDDEHLAGRIDPERRSGETGVTKRSERKEVAAVGGKTGVDVPPNPRVQPVSVTRRGRVISATDNGDRIRTPRYSPPFKII